MDKIYKLPTFNTIIKEVLFSYDPDKIAVMFNDTAISFRKLKEYTELYQKNLIKLGVKKGSCVGYTLPNSPETLYLLLAISSLGACSVPLFHMIPAPGRASILKGCRAEFLITNAEQCAALKEAGAMVQAGFKVISLTPCQAADDSFSEELPDITIQGHLVEEPDPSLPFMMASSSGTTGIPKFVVMTQENGSSVLKASYKFAQPAEESYSCMLAFPASTSGLLVLLGMLLAGVSLILSDDMSPLKYLELIQKWGADSIAAPPAYFETLLKLPMIGNYNTSSVKRVFSGMDFFSNKLIFRLKEKFPNITMAGNGYGLVETTLVTLLWQAGNEEELNNPASCLTLVKETGNDIDVFDGDGNPVSEGAEGELWMRGPGVIKGYAGNIEENKTAFSNGWFRTGDFARKEGPGRITLLGRRKYLIKRGGKSVSPTVVKDVIDKLPLVKSSAVVGVPHEMYGEMIWAFVVKSSEGELASGDIMRFCRENLASYMVPDNILFIDEIPKNSGVGKVNFEALKEMAAAELKDMTGETNE